MWPQKQVRFTVNCESLQDCSWQGIADETMRELPVVIFLDDLILTPKFKAQHVIASKVFNDIMVLDYV